MCCFVKAFTRRMPVLLMLLALFLPGGAIYAYAETLSKASRIPFQYDPSHGAIVVKVCINDNQPLPFLVDTGFEGYAAVDNWVAQLYHMKPSEYTGMLVPGNVKAFVVVNQKLFIVGSDISKSVEVQKIPLLVGSLNLNLKGERLAGIIGVSLLEKAAIEINYDNSTLLFDFQPQCIASTVSKSVFPLQRSLATARYQVVCSPFKLRNGPAKLKLLLDTGLNLSRLPKDVITQLSPTATFLKNRNDLSGHHFATTWFIPSLEKVGIEAKNVEVAMSDELYEPAVGMDVLSQFHPILDFPNQLISLQPRTMKEQTSTLVAGYVGLLPSNRNGHIIVGYVQQGSPAWKAGLQVGMQILDVDKHQVGSRSLSLIRNMINGIVGTTATLKLADQHGKEYDVRLARQNEADPMTFPAVGLRIGPANLSGKESLVVVAALCASPIFMAGVRPGDQLLAVNGSPVVSKSMSDIEALLQKPVQTLTVRHLGEKTPQTLTLLIERP